MKLNTLTREETTRDVYVENLGKWIPEYKKYQKRQNSNEEEDEIIEFVEEEEEEEQQIEVVAPRGHLSSGVQLFHLLIYSIHRPPVHPESGRRPLEIR